MKRKIDNVSLGADPEVFLYDTKEDEIISAEGLIGGTKENPRKIDNTGYALQEDNVMVEFNIPPSFTKLEFVDNIRYMLEYIALGLPDHLKVKIEPAAYLDFKYLSTEQAMLFGCEPDFNVWEGKENPKPKGEETNLRTCGGHIHIGYSNPNKEVSTELIKALDLFLGVPLSVLEPTNPRKELYGNLGACRFKSYGVEYRTPSNFWLSNQQLIEFTYSQVKLAIKKVNEEFFTDVYYDMIIKAINHNDKESAYSLINSLNLCELEKIKV